MTTTERMTTKRTGYISAPDAPRYITIKEAADALASRPWPVAELIEAGELRAIRYDRLTLVSAYDVEQLGGKLRCGLCGCADDALIHHATANGHDFAGVVA